MVILVTGACGFVGSTVVAVLKKMGAQVIGVGLSARCENVWVDDYLQCDISDQKEIDRLIRRVPACDVIVHLAATISFNNFDVKMLQNNIDSTLHIARFALTVGAKQLVFSSGIPVIGIPRNLPITEANECAPTTLYHISKLMGEMVLNLPEFSEIAMTVLRFAAPISPTMPQNRMLSVFMRKALNKETITLHGTGSRVQNYVDTRDIGAAIVAAINQRKPGLYLIGGESISNYEVAVLCNNICNSIADINCTSQTDRENDYRWIISNEKSARELGYYPVFDVKSVLMEMKAIMVVT